MAEAAHDLWDEVYRAKPEDQVSWFEAWPTVSFRLIQSSCATGSVVDVGAGTSRLGDALCDAGWSDVTLLDVSEAALAVTRQRLKDRRGISYVVADVLQWQPERAFDVWHDRAVFHFLTTGEDVSRYVELVSSAVVPGGTVVLGTFAEDGPRQCSGLPTRRYDADLLVRTFGDGFVEQARKREEHRTPWGAVQPFTWVVLQRR